MTKESSEGRRGFCGNRTAGGKLCVRDKGHDGQHSDGRYAWGGGVDEATTDAEPAAWRVRLSNTETGNVWLDAVYTDRQVRDDVLRRNSADAPHVTVDITPLYAEPEAENERLREARNLYLDAARRFAEACPLGWAYGARIRAREEASEDLYEVMDSVIRMVHWDRNRTPPDSAVENESGDTP